MRVEVWSKERIALLERLWAEGKTATAIAAQLHLSRSAVLGKVFRLRLRMRGEAAASNKALSRRRAVARRKPSSRPAPAPAAAAAPARSHGLSLFELTNETCRWPFGRPGTPNFHFCGAPGADLENGMPYCPLHARRAYANNPGVPRRPPPTAAKLRVAVNPKRWRA